MTELQKRLFDMRDEEYAVFQAKLTPSVPPENFIGIRLPLLRKFAKEFSKSEESKVFMTGLPHKYYDENLLHSVLIQTSKNFDECINNVETFLPYVDNWAVCDTLSPKIFAKHKDELLPFVKKWISDGKTYTCRFGVDMLMTYYLDGDFKKEYLTLPLNLGDEDYYVYMAVAWYYATALAKQWDDTIPVIEKKLLPKKTHNKTVQKACESYRITDEQKAYLKSLKI